ncbi:spermatogenesis-associated protein 6 [Apis dorsata]|uniref:spermatogenesis-associated protein 6 n=1 Tax=Apis dorsata TaxID=7462 RepID=UPI0003DF6450|nr:spermatogenesis-associated protein 6 [Apis dorsata]
MAGKGFCVKIKLELHAITCPGVWLCPNGKIALRITSLGSILESHRVSPIFPLLFHNEFNFKKTFTRLAALTELQRILEKQPFYAELIQWLNPCNQPIILATFHTSLADLLYPVAHCKHLLPGVDIDLLMDPTKYFPGIIAPKIEISTKTVIEEVKTIYHANIDQSCVFNPKTIDSKQKSYTHKKRAVKGIIRQRKVCHSRAKSKNQVCYPARYRCKSCNDIMCPYQIEPYRTSQCYHPLKQKLKSQKNLAIHVDANDALPSHEIPFICGNLHIFDSCPVCLKYKCYFSSECDGTSPDKSIPINLCNYQHYGCHCLPNGQLSQEPISTVPGLTFSAKDSKSNV